MRGLMSIILRTLSDPPENAEQCTSWNDVHEMVNQVIDLATPASLAPVQKELKKFFSGVVALALEISPTFVSPPPYK